ncbi:hypothetical protein AM593_07708, partial [Mytilus galloprovincialis]
MVIDRAHSIQSLANTDLTRALDRSRKFVSYIYKHHENIMTNEKLLTELQAIKFLPVKRRPRHWNIIWGGEKLDSTEQGCSKNENECIPLLFECPTNLHAESILELVCSLEPVLDRSSLPYGIDNQFIKELGVIEEDGVDLKTILENLKTICQCFDEKGPVADELDILDKTTMKIYKYLDKTFKQNAYDDEQLEEILQVAAAYSGKKLILLNGQFIQPCQLFLDLSEDCSPYLYGLNTAVHLRTLKGFMTLLGIHEQCSVEATMQVLSSIQERNESNDMSEDAVRVYVKLLRVLVHANVREQLPKQHFQSLYIPDTKGVLTHVGKLCVDEVNITSLGRMKFTHPSISFDIAFALGINSKREQKIEECSRPIEMFSKDFGQHEELITRIKRILSGYPCDAGVLKELLQNADDAKASEVHIVIDYNNHETDNLFSDSWKPLQGPAILIYNDSSFSEADIRGIQKLGIGSKGEDPTKTGQYGVGFNAVYHLTDVPSFLTKGDNVETGEILCMMDPHCQFVPKATPESPGRQYFQTEILKTDYPNVFKCYYENLIMKEHGTIFRLPLRTSTLAATSKISAKDINESFIRHLIENFQEEMSEILLFVNNVKTVRLSEIVDGKLKEKCAVTVEMTESDEANRRRFYKELHSCSYKIGQTKDPDCIDMSEVKYKISVNDTFGKKKNWMIVRRIGFPTHSPESVLEAYRQDELGVLPRGGVAVLLPIEDKVIPSKGHHEARRNLWTEEKEGYRSAWNKTLLKNVIAPAYASALHLVKDNLGLQEGTLMTEKEVTKLNDAYHTFWPEVCKASNEYFKFLAQSIYQWIFQNEESLFLSYKYMKEAQVEVKFHPLICSEMVFPCVFNTLTEGTMPSAAIELISSVSQSIGERVDSLQRNVQKLEDETKRQTSMHTLVRLLKDLGIKLLDSPKAILNSLKASEVKITEISPDFLIYFLKSFDSENADKCHIGNIREAIEQTTLSSVENLVTCIKYCQQSQTFEDEIEGLPLCLTNDCILRVFSNDYPVFSSKFCYILNESSNLFLHSELHKTDIFNRHISVRNCYEIMGFICENLDKILENSDAEIQIDKMKAIPLHSNVNGHNISISGHSSILVLDESVSRDIVVDGIEEWAISSGTILLKTSSKLKKLYARMGLTNENNPFNDLMKLMCGRDDFPGEPFDKRYWKYLLETAGIKNEITRELILDFAHIVEHLGRIQVTDEVRNKSARLIEYILNRNDVQKESVLREIRGIKFIVPHTVEDWKSHIYQQPETKLICFQNAVPVDYSDICWTTCSILPYFANPQNLHFKSRKIQNEMLQQLQVQKEPSLDNVIHHTQNVCDSLKLLANQDGINDRHVIWIEQVLIHVYAWLLKYKDSNSEKLKTSLAQKPIIFLPKSKLFVTCDRVVKSLQVEEIRPYLMEVPEQYGAYFKLFELLGMNTRENICNFVKVLGNLHIDIGNNVLHVNELQTVRKAMQGICNHLPLLNDELKTDLSNIDALYLPTRDKFLANARNIVLSNNSDYEEKIGNDIGMPYMIHLNDLKVFGVGNIVLDFKKLPLKLQPNILSDMIERELNAEALTVRFDEKGRLFRDFIVTPQFLEAAVRIAVHCHGRKAFQAKETEIDVDKIITSIEKLQIMQVDMVQLKLVFGSKIVGNSEESCYYYTKNDMENETEHILLCCFKDKKITKWVVENSRAISRALQSCSNNEFTDTEGLLFVVLHHLKNPDSISKALDKEGISQYSITQRCRTSIFPPPGTYVHSDWHCYLDNSFSNFEVGEYVALLLNEESIENDTFIPALYIYAIIVQKFEEASPSSLLDSTLCMYEVDVGERKERKRAYDLYKFNRSTQESSTELAPFLNIAESPKDDRNLDDILKEVKEILKAAWTLPEDERRKVVRRLYKKWHPDKNIGNEDFATKVCQFLQQIVFKLESGQDIDSDSSTTFEPSTGSHFYSHFKTWDRDARHDSNRNNRRRGRRGGRSGHSRRQPSEPVPSCHESRQWIRQAKVHLTGAIEFLPNADIGPNFNSICMICYQSVEIALKAVHYRTDANNIPETKNISDLVAKLDGDLKTLVEKLVTLVGKPERIIYPDKLNIPKIPSQMYSKDTATRAVEVTKTILDFISDRTLNKRIQD